MNRFGIRWSTFRERTGAAPHRPRAFARPRPPFVLLPKRSPIPATRTVS